MSAQDILDKVAKFAETKFRGPLYAVWMQDNVLRIHQGSREKHGYFASVHPHQEGDQVKLMTRTEQGKVLQAMLSPEDCIRRLECLAEVA